MSTEQNQPQSASCRYCAVMYATTSNYGENRRIDLPTGGWAHYGCFLHWLIDDALTRNFPGLLDRERRVLKLRLGVKPPSYPDLRNLGEVGSAMGWKDSMRASQVQLDAWAKYSIRIRGLADARDAERAKSAERRAMQQELEEGIAAARSFIEKAERLIEPPNPFSFK